MTEKALRDLSLSSQFAKISSFVFVSMIKASL